MVEISQVIASCIICFLLGAGFVTTCVTTFCVVFHYLKKADKQEHELKRLQEEEKKVMLQ